MRDSCWATDDALMLESTMERNLRDPLVLPHGIGASNPTLEYYHCFQVFKFSSPCYFIKQSKHFHARHPCTLLPSLGTCLWDQCCGMHLRAVLITKIHPLPRGSLTYNSISSIISNSASRNCLCSILYISAAIILFPCALFVISMSCCRVVGKQDNCSRAILSILLKNFLSPSLDSRLKSFKLLHRHVIIHLRLCYFTGTHKLRSRPCWGHTPLCTRIHLEASSPASGRFD